MKEKQYFNERWKPVIFEGIRDGEKYEISNYGRIRDYRKVLNGWKVLNNTIIHGYPYFTGFKTNRGWRHNTSRCVHKLVAKTFCHRPSEEHKFVIHLNQDTLHLDKVSNYY